MEEVRSEDGQGKPLPTRLLPVHHGHRLPGAQAGTPKGMYNGFILAMPCRIDDEVEERELIRIDLSSLI